MVWVEWTKMVFLLTQIELYLPFRNRDLRASAPTGFDDVFLTKEDIGMFVKDLVLLVNI